jgi:hypothetical protein
MTFWLMAPARDAGTLVHRSVFFRGRWPAMLAGSVALVAGLLSTSGLKAQDERGNLIESPRMAVPTLQRVSTGTVMRAPRVAINRADLPPPRVRCQFVCSAITPRTPIAQIVVDGEAREISPALRLDFATTPQAMREGDFGSVPLMAIPEARVQPGTGIDFERLRVRDAPVFLDRVREFRVVPRDTGMDTTRLRSVRPNASTAMDTSPDLREAMVGDLRSGALQQIRAIAQGVEVQRGTPQRTLVFEGLQPGMSYEIRLVRDGVEAAESLGENVCRVPVCPADYVVP